MFVVVYLSSCNHLLVNYNVILCFLVGLNPTSSPLDAPPGPTSALRHHPLQGGQGQAGPQGRRRVGGQGGFLTVLVDVDCYFEVSELLWVVMDLEHFMHLCE